MTASTADVAIDAGSIYPVSEDNVYSTTYSTVHVDEAATITEESLLRAYQALGVGTTTWGRQVYPVDEAPRPEPQNDPNLRLDIRNRNHQLLTKCRRRKEEARLRELMKDEKLENDLDKAFA